MRWSLPSRRRRPTAIAAAACALLALLTSYAADAQQPGPSARGEEKRSQAAELAEAPAVTFESPQRVYAGGGEAGEAARRAADAIPLPEGGNFHGIRWEDVEGELTDADVQHVLEYNAACQWLRAARDEREARLAREVLREVGRWSALRMASSGAVWREVAQDLERSGEGVHEAVLGDCDAAHAREVAYATSRGLTPSR